MTEKFKGNWRTATYEEQMARLEDKISELKKQLADAEERGAREMATVIREGWPVLSHISTGKDRTEDWIAKWEDQAMRLWRERRAGK